MKPKDLYISAGTPFNLAAINAKQYAEKENTYFMFRFNGIACYVAPFTDLDLLYRDYQNALTLGWAQIGPYCVEQVDPEIQSKIEQIQRTTQKATVSSKFSWGQVVWFLYENKIRKGPIVGVIFHYRHDIDEFSTKDLYVDLDPIEFVSEDQCFASKEELIAYLESC